MLKTDLTTLNRLTLEALIVANVHAKDIVELLINCNI